MCLIGLRRNNSALSVEQFTNSHDRNSDGLGIMYVEDGRVKVHKCMSPKFKAHKKLFMQHMHRPNFAFHQRFATHGWKNYENCHPYKILDLEEDGMDLFMMHNGVITGLKENDKSKSDTWHFAMEVLKPILKSNPRLIYDNAQFQRFITGFLGFNNKLVFLNEKEESLIFNEDRGSYVGKTWFSNLTSIAPPYKTPSYPSYNQNNYGSTYNANNSNVCQILSNKTEVKKDILDRVMERAQAIRISEKHIPDKELIDKVNAINNEKDEEKIMSHKVENITAEQLEAEIEKKVMKIVDDYITKVDQYEAAAEAGVSNKDSKDEILSWLFGEFMGMDDDEFINMATNEPVIVLDLFNYLGRLVVNQGEEKAA